MKFKTKVAEVEAVRWDGKLHGFWNGVISQGALALSQPNGTKTWLGEAVSKQQDEDGAVWSDGDLLYVRHADDSEGSQEVFDRLYEAV